MLVAHKTKEICIKNFPKKEKRRKLEEMTKKRKREKNK